MWLHSIRERCFAPRMLMLPVALVQSDWFDSGGFSSVSDQAGWAGDD